MIDKEYVITKQVFTYIKALNQQDLPTLARLYTNDVVLDEWGQRRFTGIDSVLTANETMFEKNPEMKFMVVNHAVNEYSALVVLNVFLEDPDTLVEPIKVVDEICFVFDSMPVPVNQSLARIFLIKAYRGF